MTVQKAQQELSTTPPTSFTQPLTPPHSDQKSRTVVEDILDEIEQRKDAVAVSRSPWSRHILSVSSYRELDEFIKADNILKEKLRFDYFPSIDLFVLRMPSSLHETIVASVVEEIGTQLRARAELRGAVAEFARMIRSNGAGSIVFADSQFGRHDPDASFKHLSARYPGVVIEVSYSQKRGDLRRLADDYILGSDGNIRLMIGIDISYNNKSATVSTWRPAIKVNARGEEELTAHQTLSNQEFRVTAGEPIGSEETGLRIGLEDFAPSSLRPEQTSPDDDLFIPYAKLRDFLRDAESSESTTKPNSGVSEPLAPHIKKRRRSSTPAEELNTDDEHQFEEEERRVLKRLQREDSSFQGG